MAFIVAMIVGMLKQDVALLEKDYYTKGENYQTTINENKGADSLLNVSIENIAGANAKTLRIRNPFQNKVKEVNIYFYYLADKAQDKQMVASFNDSSNSCMIDLTNFAKGNWLSKITWRDEQGQHYIEKRLSI